MKQQQHVSSPTDALADAIAERVWERLSAKLDTEQRIVAFSAKGKSAVPIGDMKYLTLREAGVVCGGRSAEAMRQMARRGRIRVIKVGKRLFMDKADIDAAMSGGKLEIPSE